MDECDVLDARRTRRSVHGLSFSLSPPRRNGWLIRQRISDVASRKPEPDCDGPVGLEGRGAAITGTAMPGAAETSVEGNYGDYAVGGARTPRVEGSARLPTVSSASTTTATTISVTRRALRIMWIMTSWLIRSART